MIGKVEKKTYTWINVNMWDVHFKQATERITDKELIMRLNSVKEDYSEIIILFKSKQDFDKFLLLVKQTCFLASPKLEDTLSFVSMLGKGT